MADPDIIPILSVPLGDGRLGPTPEGGVAFKANREGETSGFKVGIELRRREPVRWGVGWWWRF